MLGRLQAGFEAGEFEESVYQRQISASFRELFALQKQYNMAGHSFATFLEGEKSLGDLRKILGKIAELNESYSGQTEATLATLQLKSYKEFAAVASDLTASFITLLDCIKLRGVAKPALLVEFLGNIITHAKKMELDPSFIARLEELQAELKAKNDALPDEDLDLLEHQVDVLFTEFQLDLKKESKK